MEVKSANIALQMNRVATAVDNSGSDNGGNEQPKIHTSNVTKENVSPEEEYVKVSISKAGLQKSKDFEDNQTDDDLVSQAEAEEMMKKVEGLSSQVINGNFSITDRLNFQSELKMLTKEISHYNGDGISFTKTDNALLSQKISDLTIRMNEAAVYRKSASAYFVVKSQKMYKTNTRTKLDIAI